MKLRDSNLYLQCVVVRRLLTLLLKLLFHSTKLSDNTLATYKTKYNIFRGD